MKQQLTHKAYELEIAKLRSELADSLLACQHLRFANKKETDDLRKRLQERELACKATMVRAIEVLARMMVEV